MMKKDEREREKKRGVEERERERKKIITHFQERKKTATAKTRLVTSSIQQHIGCGEHQRKKREREKRERELKKF